MFGLQASAPAASSTAKRQRPQGKTDEAMDNELLAQVAQLTLATAASVNTVRATTIDVYLVSRDTQVITDMKTAEKRYNESTKSMTPQQRAVAGPPHIMMWEQMCLSTVNGAGELPKNHIEDLANQITQINERAGKIEFVAESVKMCRVSPCFDKKMAKLEVSCKPGSQAAMAWEQMKKILKVKFAAQPRYGTQPRGDLERRIVTTLGEMGQLRQRQAEW
eukprot:TRINITY_DN48859_c0_g1_i1.p1 TRINITY_DN48859_c0_g1~~TRINITY_DN48859_c0_g1_i1.p1  ORF type:complete len:220 (+),score=56.66 TRINITY_DN48859_c0_g1_i1:119-778(+)